MKAVILPGFFELIIEVNPSKEVTRKGLLDATMPWEYAPWPEASKKGIAPIEFQGNTLKSLLIELGRRYAQAGVVFKPFVEETDQLDFDYDVFINDKDFITLSAGVDTILNPDDEVKVKVTWQCS
jgi:hypothetical protein